MTNEIMPREDRMGKMLAFLGGCLTGVLGVFAVAVMSDKPSCSTSPCDLGYSAEQGENQSLQLKKQDIDMGF